MARIKAPSKGRTYEQTQLIPIDEYDTTPDDWCRDDWATPDNLARAIAGMVEPHEKKIVEFSAGTGAIAKYLPDGSFCIELHPMRCETGRALYPQHKWVCLLYTSDAADD